MSEASTDRDVLITAGRALGRIDLYGPRGLTLLSLEQIEAMALALVILGLVAIPPHQIAPPERLIVERN